MAFSFLYLTTSLVSLDRHLNWLYQTNANLHLTVPLYFPNSLFLSILTYSPISLNYMGGSIQNLKRTHPPCMGMYLSKQVGTCTWNLTIFSPGQKVHNGGSIMTCTKTGGKKCTCFLFSSPPVTQNDNSTTVSMPFHRLFESSDIK